MMSLKSIQELVSIYPEYNLIRNSKQNI